MIKATHRVIQATYSGKTVQDQSALKSVGFVAYLGNLKIAEVSLSLIFPPATRVSTVFGANSCRLYTAPTS
jgi:hypothetical protein